MRYAPGLFFRFVRSRSKQRKSLLNILNEKSIRDTVGNRLDGFIVIKYPLRLKTK